jgi:hypothetical protein
MAGEIVPLCPTCRLWGKDACLKHQRPRGRRSCPDCRGSGLVTFMSWGQGGTIEAGEEPCECAKPKREEK